MLDSCSLEIIPHKLSMYETEAAASNVTLMCLSNDVHHLELTKERPAGAYLIIRWVTTPTHLS